jgi:hypothetical protein
MRKSFGLAVVGFALTFGVGSRFASQARVNQPIPATSTFGEQQLLANDNLLRVTAFPKEEVSAHDSRIEHSSANHFDSSVTSQRTENLSMGKLYAQTTRQEIPETEEVEGLSARYGRCAIAQIASAPDGGNHPGDRSDPSWVQLTKQVC